MENQEPGIPAENADQVVTSDRKRTDASPQAILEGRDVGQSDGEDSQVPGIDEVKPKEKWRPPKIYYATRTHSQIAQVVRELKRTTYRPKMAILASREHYCVNKQVLKKPNKDEECNNLIGADGAGCQYFKNTAVKMYGQQSSIALQVHDIEDLCNFGKSQKACPYFAARHFAGEADLVFCPYNYLIDPVIRNSMDVDISSAVLIFDEAHNIEDNARDAASAELELSSLEEAQAACSRVSQIGERPDIYGPLAQRLAHVAEWLKQRACVGLKDQGRECYEGVWSGQQAIEELRQAHLDQEGVDAMQKLYTEVRAEEEKAREVRDREAGGNVEAPPRQSQASEALKIGGLAHGVISRLLTTLKLMHEAGTEYVQDYRLAVQKWMTQQNSSFRRPRNNFRARHAALSDEVQVSVWNLQLCLWCLNPAVAFWEVNQKAKSVILTSGTLAPLDSFASELGADFPIRLEAPHVVNMKRQVFAGVMGSGPWGEPLQATYRFSSDPKFQDVIGESILAACKVVPDGVLCFMPSYSLLDRLMQRWQGTGMWRALDMVKPISCEPRGSGEDFDAVMTRYYDGIQTGRGGLFFAVCRGKVSEGLDFADANARAVLVIGIPYPNVKDTKVGLKKKYNDDGHRSRGLLTGDNWYSQQAFRALNQAIGRCLRHRLDYGAIILIDERFKQPRNQQHLSRWVKGALTVQPSFDAVLGNMEQFFQRLTADPPGGCPIPSRQPGPDKSLDPLSANSHLRAMQRSNVVASEMPSAKTVADSEGGEFVSKSQPTLNLLWKNPGQQHPQRLLHKPPQPPLPKGINSTPSPSPASLGHRILPSWNDPKSAIAAGWIKAPTQSPTPAKPGQVKMTQTRGGGAAGVYGDFAKTPNAHLTDRSFSSPSQAQMPTNQIDESLAQEKKSSEQEDSRHRVNHKGEGIQHRGYNLHIPPSLPSTSQAAAPIPAVPARYELSRKSDFSTKPGTEPTMPAGNTCSASGSESNSIKQQTANWQDDPENVKFAPIQNRGEGGWKALVPGLLQADVVRFMEYLVAFPLHADLKQNEQQEAALEAIMDSFLFALETSLLTLLQQWHGTLPAGLIIIAKAKGIPSSLLKNHEATQISQHDLIILWPEIASMAIAEAVQIMAEVYDEQILQLQTQIQEAGRASIGFQIHKHDAGLGRSNVTGGPEDWMSTLSEQQAQQRGGSAALHPSPEKEGPGVAYGCRSAVSALQAARNVPKRQKMDSGPVSDLAPLPGTIPSRFLTSEIDKSEALQSVCDKATHPVQADSGHDTCTATANTMNQDNAALSKFETFPACHSEALADTAQAIPQGEAHGSDVCCLAESKQKVNAEATSHKGSERRDAIALIKVLSKNAVAAMAHKRNKTRPTTWISNTKAEGWDSDSDLEMTQQ